MISAKPFEHALDRSEGTAADEQRGFLPGDGGHQTRRLHLALYRGSVIAFGRISKTVSNETGRQSARRKKKKKLQSRPITHDDDFWFMTQRSTRD